MEQEQNWIFTFGFGQEHQNQYIKIFGTFDSARQKMFKRYESKWAFQYPAETKEAHLIKYGLRELV